MPNIKSAKKRTRQMEKRNERNKALRTFLKNLRKKTAMTILNEEVSKDDAFKALNHFKSETDKAWRKGIHKRNKASRQVSQMESLYKNRFEAQA